MIIYILAALPLLLIFAVWWLYTPDKPRAALEARYADTPSQFLELDGVRLHLRDTGPRSAPAVLLLHGFGSSLHTWEEVAQGLEADFRVIRFDLPGFGLTGADRTGDYSDARSHAVILTLMQRLGLERVALVGSSMGGRIAWSFAAAHPEHVTRLVLMAPDGFASPGIGYEQPPKVPLIMRVLPYTLPEGMLRGSLTPAYGDPGVMTEALFERYRDMMLAPGVRQAILDRMAQHVLLRPEPLLARITLPVLLLWGDTDRMVPVTNAQDYLRALPDARLVTLPGKGHVPMEESPTDVVRILREFLAGR
ncbi:alpha/beta fold hydrolase [Sediminicoccus sp. KRV36]|uniref:alpha/beta fold hydrolase n=1 Tax=Sediminicoccus sp. KRV36 TaxID=3133721 RepID=UPI00200BF76F|nr:alpha/beta fold hydrolase [Sediminicoccus rosea]UPY37538.1 alpha/beta fold hydrolase [Sediminicoccus rosea]